MCVSEYGIINRTTCVSIRTGFFSIIAVLLCCCVGGEVFAQGPSTPTADSAKTAKRKRISELQMIPTLAVMPYATISYNFQSGQAFPKAAQGVGYGFGLAFDFAPEKQPLGLYLDFAYQDMRASANDGAAKVLHDGDSIAVPVPVTHYFSYALAEVFLKLQSERANGYFLIGFSTGIATTSLSVKEGPGLPEYSDWHGTSHYNAFRFDLRGGVGIKLGHIGTHDLIFEARFGYPITTIIHDYQDFANSSGTKGSWRAVSLQGNFGLRF